MQAADNAAMRFALIILYETDVLAHGGFEDVVAICLGEVAASITYGLGLDDDDIRDGVQYVSMVAITPVWNCVSSNQMIRYSKMIRR